MLTPWPGVVSTATTCQVRVSPAPEIDEVLYMLCVDCKGMMTRFVMDDSADKNRVFECLMTNRDE